VRIGLIAQASRSWASQVGIKRKAPADRHEHRDVSGQIDESEFTAARSGERCFMYEEKAVAIVTASTAAAKRVNNPTANSDAIAE
jgi:hypothetical protein